MYKETRVILLWYLFKLLFTGALSEILYMVYLNKLRQEKNQEYNQYNPCSTVFLDVTQSEKISGTTKRYSVQTSIEEIFI